MSYELWDVESGNRIGKFASQREALAAVRRERLRVGDAEADALALVVIEPSRGPRRVAEGRQLLVLADGDTPARSALGRARGFRPLGFLRGIVPIDSALPEAQ